MRKIIVMLMMSMIGSGMLMAQDGETQAGGDWESSFGGKLAFGFGFPSYDGLPESAETESDVAFSGGVFWNYSAPGVVAFAIQPELHYVVESGVLNWDFIGGQVSTETQSLRLPVLAKLQFLDRNIIQPSIYAGPSFSYVLSATQTSGDVTTDIEDIDRFQVGIALGVDVTIVRFIVVDIRYNNKFTALTGDLQSDFGDVSLSMHSLRFGLGVRF